MSTQPITILLADDHRVVREALRALLDAEGEFQVVGEAADGLTAADLTESQKPDVLVLDLQLPELNGLDVLRRVTRRSPRTRVVVLSMHATEEHVIAALKHGASAYVTKDASAAELATAIRTVVAGERYVGSPFSGKAVEEYVGRAEGSVPDPYQTLTGREREVLQLAAEGRSSAQIAERLRISPRTAETHRANALKKLKLHGQTNLVLYAVERGILQSAGPEELREPRP